MSQITPQEAAEILGVSVKRVYQLIERGSIKARRVRFRLRVDRDSVEQFGVKPKSLGGRPTKKG